MSFAVLALWALALCSDLSCAAPAAGDVASYPDRPVRIVVAFSGVTGQSLARIIAERLERELGQPIVVEPRPGASGNIASDLVAHAAPDGYTLLLALATTTLLPATHGARAIDPIRAFVPIMRLATQPLAVVAHRSLNVATLGALLDSARARPKRLEYATPGVGTINHLAAAMLWSRADVELLHVPYASSSIAMKDLVAGVVPVSVSVPATAEPFVRAGQLQMLALTSPRRWSAYPDVPTVAESGFPGFETESWYGLVAPAGTPHEIIQRLYHEIARILELPAVRERIVPLGVEIAPTTPEQLGGIMRAEVARWSAVVKSAGIDVSQMEK